MGSFVRVIACGVLAVALFVLATAWIVTTNTRGAPPLSQTVGEWYEHIFGDDCCRNCEQRDCYECCRGC